MADEVEIYQRALSAKTQHEETLHNTFKRVKELIQAVNTYGCGKIIVNGVQMPVLPKSSPSFDPKGWPTGQDIATMLVKWHELDGQVRNAWNKIPENRRTGLSRPS